LNRRGYALKCSYAFGQQAIIKAKMEFRKIISGLNRKLDTVQIKQCAQAWSNIDPGKQTSITLQRQNRAFLNIDKKGVQRSILEDRIDCATHFKEYIDKSKEGNVIIKGKRLGLNDFTKEALKIIKYNQTVSPAADLLNAQWKNNATQNSSLGRMIAMVDVSGSMDGEPLHSAIALGIRIAEKSILGKRVLTFSSTPTWVNLDGYDNFIDMVDELQKSDWGVNTNFHAALTMILDAIIESKLEPDTVEDLTLTILSDMQMDHAGCEDYSSLMTSIEIMYADTGIKLWNKPFKVPHIIFWNLRSTSGFPTLSNQPNASMMSGFSPSLLNNFCEEGRQSLTNLTPWLLLVESLSKKRYEILDSYLRVNL
jgi:hypothetical protein